MCSVSLSHLTVRPSVVWAPERWAGHWVSRKNSRRRGSSLLSKTSEQQTDRLIIVPDMKQFVLIRRRCSLLSHFHHRHFLIFIPVCPSSVCRAPLHRPHATTCLFSFLSRLWLRFTSAPVLLTLLPSLFRLAAPSVPSVRLHPHLYVFPDKWGRRRRWRAKGAAPPDSARQSLAYSPLPHRVCAALQHSITRSDFCIYFGLISFEMNVSSEQTDGDRFEH